MTDEKRIPRIDLSRIQFPSDRITLGQLRQRWAEGFHGNDITQQHNILADILATAHLEHRLAEKAFAAAAGLPDPDPEPLVMRQEAIRLLDDEYRKQGISTGPMQTRDLIRSFESAAAEQGRTVRGTAR